MTPASDEAFTIATDDCDGVFLSVDAVRRIAYELPVVGIDLVEVSPPYDHADITASLANRVVLEALSGIARRRRDAADGTTWDPGLPLLADRPDRRPTPSQESPDD